MSPLQVQKSLLNILPCCTSFICDLRLQVQSACLRHQGGIGHGQWMGSRQELSERGNRAGRLGRRWRALGLSKGVCFSSKREAGICQSTAPPPLGPDLKHYLPSTPLLSSPVLHPPSLYPGSQKHPCLFYSLLWWQRCP